MSSSEALLPPPCLLLALMRLELRFDRIMALMGRWCTPPAGDAGGEVAIAGSASVAVPQCVVQCETVGWSEMVFESVV